MADIIPVFNKRQLIIEFLIKSLQEYPLIKSHLLQAKRVKYFMWKIQRAHCVYQVSFDLRAEISSVVLPSLVGNSERFRCMRVFYGLPLAEVG